MRPNLILILIGFVLAGFNIWNPSASSFEKKIKSADIKAIKKVIKKNSKYLENPKSEEYRNEAFLYAVNKGKISVVELFLKEINVDVAALNERTYQSSI